MRFTAFIKAVDPALARQFFFETFKGGTKTPKKPAEVVAETHNNNNEKGLLDKLLPRLDTLDHDHFAREYIAKRKLPPWALEQLYYLDSVAKITELSPSYRDKITSNEPRILIPAYSRDGLLTGVTCRAILDHPIRYVQVKISQSKPIIFGLERLDLNKRIYVVEGPLDSFFLSNCIAVGTSALVNKAKAIVNKRRDVFVFDNQPRNAEIVKMVRAALLNDYNVVIWPSRIEEKDLNDMALAGHDVQKLVDENIKQGKGGLTAWDNWRRL